MGIKFKKQEWESVRIRKEAHTKLKELADKEFRPVGRQIELIINKYLEEMSDKTD